MKKIDSKAFWWALASSGVMVVGALGPWARVLGLFSVSGTDAETGWIVVGAAALAAGLVYWDRRRDAAKRRWPLLMALVAALAVGSASLVAACLSLIFGHGEPAEAPRPLRAPATGA